MDGSATPLCNLAREPTRTVAMDGGYSSGGNSWLYGLIVFIILVLIIYLIVVAIRPSWILDTLPDGTTQVVNQWKAILGSIVIAITIGLILWLLFALLAPAPTAVVVV